MIEDVLEVAISLYLPYFTPIIFILLAIVVADRLREVVTSAFLGAAYGKKRRSE